MLPGSAVVRCLSVYLRIVRPSQQVINGYIDPDIPAEGQIFVSDDFDAPLDDFKESWDELGEEKVNTATNGPIWDEKEKDGTNGYY